MHWLCVRQTARKREAIFIFPVAMHLRQNRCVRLTNCESFSVISIKMGEENKKKDTSSKWPAFEDALTKD